MLFAFNNSPVRDFQAFPGRRPAFKFKIQCERLLVSKLCQTCRCYDSAEAWIFDEIDFASITSNHKHAAQMTNASLLMDLSLLWIRIQFLTMASSLRAD